MSTKEELRETSNSPPGKCEVPAGKQNQVGTVMLFGVPIVSLVMDGKERLCLAQISSTLLKDFSYNEIHNRRVALGINCVQCTPVQLEILRRAGAMPVTSRRCGMITRREAERLCKSFLGDHAPPQLPENFAFDVYHECGWGCRGSFVPSRYNSSRAKCIRCSFCQLFFSPNKFIFHSHRLPESRYVQPDAANFNSWRRHMKLCGDPPEEGSSPNSTPSDMATAQIVHAWEDVKAMFNGGTRKRLLAATVTPSPSSSHRNSSHSSGGGKSESSGKGKSHGDSQSSTSRGSHAHSSPKKEPSSVSTSSQSPSSVPPPSHHSLHHNYHDAPMLQSQQNALLHATNPLLSPSSRIDSIWNPGLPGQTARPSMPTSPSFSLPFHPLSIPWLRRPIFPFSHPFGPTLLNDPTTTPEKLVNLARQNHSAFKPVSRSVDPIFNWINSNSLAGLPPAVPTLPEDLSVTSVTPGTANGAHQLPTFGGSHSTGKQSQEKEHRNEKNHQVQIMSNQTSDTDDEENVDIESTGETEECSSTSSIWVSSTTALGRCGSSPSSQFPGNNNNSVAVGNKNIQRRKRAQESTYSSGEDDGDNESDNQDDTVSTYYEDRERQGKRKRLWVNEIISTTDEEDERQVKAKMHRSSSSVRVLMSARD